MHLCIRIKQTSSWVKFSCLKGHLERALGIAERFTGKNVTLPILGNVLFTVKGNTLLVSATNLEYAVEVIVQGKGLSDDRVSVPAKVINSFIQSLQDQKVDLEGRQGNLFIKTETRDIRINGVSPEDFPLIPKIKKTHSFTAEGPTLIQRLGKVLPAVSPSEFKPELAGVFFRVSPGVLRLASTDTFRLSEATMSLSGKKTGDSFSMILPHRTSQEVARVLGEEEVEISVGDNQAEFTTPTIRMVSRLIEGNFPDYTSIIPKKFETTGFLKRKEFLGAIRGSITFASKLQEVTLDFKGGKLTVSSLNPEVGEYRSELSAPSTGKDVSVSFNHRYLLDGVDSLEEEELFIGLNGQDGPALLRDKSSEALLYVLMPIRLS